MAKPYNAQRLQCSEVWGGNDAADRLISVIGMEAQVVSCPLDDAGSGGDIHYISTCAAGLISRFFLADVSGHDQAAAGVAGTLRRLMAENLNEVDQSRFTQTINREFSALAQAGRFATAILATYFAPTGYFIVSNAGHPPPLWYRAEAGEWDLLTCDAPGVLASGSTACGPVADLPLGIIEATEYRQFLAPLGQDDRIIMYTDALIEAAPPGGAQLGSEGLLRLASDLGADASGSALLSAAAEYRQSPADDDATVVTLRTVGEQDAAPSLLARVRGLGRRVRRPAKA